MANQNGENEEKSGLKGSKIKEKRRLDTKWAISGIFSSTMFQTTVTLCFICIVFLTVVPSPIDPEPFLTNFTTPHFEGVLTPNKKLQSAEKLFQGRILGPDSITKDEHGNFYTGLADGRIVQLTPFGEIMEIARTGQNLSVCGTYETEPKCGRPLGIRLDKNNKHLIVCDAYYGLLRINIQSKEIETLISVDEDRDGVPFRFLNDVAISSEDVVYFTDSSWKWQRRNSRYAVLEATGRGRLLSYNMATKETRTLLRDLFIPNGLLLSNEEDFILVAETTTSRILRYYMKGPKRGTHDIFIENLPGYPANIRLSSDGNYWVGLIAIRKWPFAFLDWVGPYPFLRRLLAKVMSQDSMTRLIPKYGLLLKIGANGQILESFHDPTGRVMSEVTDVFEDEGVLYLGSYKHDFIGKIQL